MILSSEQVTTGYLGHKSDSQEAKQQGMLIEDICSKHLSHCYLQLLLKLARRNICARMSEQANSRKGTAYLSSASYWGGVRKAEEVNLATVHYLGAEGGALM